MNRVLVTGGTGFIGQHLTSALVAQGTNVRVLDLRPPVLALPTVEYVEGSVLDHGLVDEAMNDVDEVYHLAGHPGMWLPRKQDFDHVNFRGTEIVLAAAQRRSVRRFLHCSTESILFHSSAFDGIEAEDIVPNANDMPGPYTRSKMLGDQLAMQAAASGFPVVICCPTMPIGSRDHNLTPPAAMLRHFLGARVQPYLDFIVNLVDVRDVANGLVLAMERGQIGHRYILGGESLPLKDLLLLVAETRGRRGLLIPVPAALAEMAATAFEFLADHVTGRAPTGTAEGVRIARRATALSFEKSRRELGYSPCPIKPALLETVAHLLEGRPRRLGALQTSDQYVA